MTYYWNPVGMTAPLVLPNTVADSCLKLAGEAHLKVLLWLSRHEMAWDADACANDLGLSREECDGCLAFWLAQGVLAKPGDTPATLPVAESIPAPRPAAVKPRVQEVLAYQEKNPHFADFLQHVSAMLGKAIGHGDTATLLYLIDTVGLPEDVILLEVGYAVSMGKPNMRYIEKIALDWADKDLITHKTVDDHIHKLERCRRAGERVEKLLTLAHPLNAPQCEMAEKWLEQWNFREDMLQKAAAITVEKTGKFAPAYMDKILDHWHAEGINSPDKVPAEAPATKKKKGAAATNPEESSLDTEHFDEQLLRYRPKFGNNQ